MRTNNLLNLYYMVVVHIQTGQKGRPEDVQMTASETT